MQTHAETKRMESLSTFKTVRNIYSEVQTLVDCS